MKKKSGQRLEDMQCQRYYSSEQNARIMRAHRRYEERIREELGMESQIIDVVDPDMCRSTRLDRSRILETDEDNIGLRYE